MDNNIILVDREGKHWVAWIKGTLDGPVGSDQSPRLAATNLLEQMRVPIGKIDEYRIVISEPNMSYSP